MAEIIVPAADVKAFKDACATLETIARKLANVDRSKVDDSEVKFTLIRAVRAEHMAREVRTGKSQRS